MNCYLHYDAYIILLYVCIPYRSASKSNCQWVVREGTEWSVVSEYCKQCLFPSLFPSHYSIIVSFIVPYWLINIIYWQELHVHTVAGCYCSMCLLKGIVFPPTKSILAGVFVQVKLFELPFFFNWMCCTCVYILWCNNLYSGHHPLQHYHIGSKQQERAGGMDVCCQTSWSKVQQCGKNSMSEYIAHHVLCKYLL